jgi:hypothetical protein
MRKGAELVLLGVQPVSNKLYVWTFSGDMKRAKVESTFIKSVGYESASKTLEVRYEDGSVFKYLDVPMSVALRLHQKHPGAWWANHWTDYKYEQVK